MIDKKNISMYSVFNGLNGQELESILHCCELISFSNNDVIIEESTINSDLYILTEGRVSVELTIGLGNNKEREQLVILRSGDIFGEIGFLENKRRSAHVIAMDNISAIKLDKKGLNNLFKKNSHIGYIMMKNIAITLSNRLINTNFRWKDGIRNSSSDFL